MSHARFSHLLFCVVFLFFSGMLSTEVRASCGDWLVGIDDEMTAHEDSVSQADDEAQNPLKPTPCTSPECRKQPGTPFSPTKHLVEIRSVDPICGSFKRECDGGRQNNRFAANTDSSPLSGFRLRIDRPPQISG